MNRNSSGKIYGLTGTKRTRAGKTKAVVGNKAMLAAEYFFSDNKPKRKKCQPVINPAGNKRF